VLSGGGGPGSGEPPPQAARTVKPSKRHSFTKKMCFILTYSKKYEIHNNIKKDDYMAKFLIQTLQLAN
jgi:hypothetical protein